MQSPVRILAGSSRKGLIAVRALYGKIFKAFIHRELYNRRNELGISQEEMAAKLQISLRTYADIEHGKNGCNRLTLVLFLAYHCKDPNKFLEDIRHEFDVGLAEYN